MKEAFDAADFDNSGKLDLDEVKPNIKSWHFKFVTAFGKVLLKIMGEKQLIQLFMVFRQRYFHWLLKENWCQFRWRCGMGWVYELYFARKSISQPNEGRSN